MAVLAQFIDGAGRRGKSGSVGLMTADTAGAVFALLSGYKVDPRIIFTGFFVVAFAAGVFGGADVQRLHKVGIMVGAVAGGAVRGVAGAASESFSVEAAIETGEGVGMTAGTINFLIDGIMGKIVVISGLLVAVDAVEAAVDALLEALGVNADDFAFGGKQGLVFVTDQTVVGFLGFYAKDGCKQYKYK